MGNDGLTDLSEPEVGREESWWQEGQKQKEKVTLKFLLSQNEADKREGDT